MRRRSCLGGLMWAGGALGWGAAGATECARAGARAGAQEGAPPRHETLELSLPEPPVAGRARLALALPADCGEPRWPMLVVQATSDPGHASSLALMKVYQAAALAAGWAVLAVDAEPLPIQAEDTLARRHALLKAALTAVRERWPQLRGPVGLGGFSGGAKYAAWLAALLMAEGERLAGLFLAGLNEEVVAPAARQLELLDARYRRLPIVLQSAQSDTVASPRQQRAVAGQLRDQGFRHVRLLIVAGPHAPSAEGLREALVWMAERPLR